MIEVVSAVIIRYGGTAAAGRAHRILLTQRTPAQDHPLTWECPGGKVDGDHESHHSALARELKEELGIEAPRMPESSMWCGTVCSGAVFLLMYRTFIDDSEQPAPREGQGIGWFTAVEMRHLSLAPGNVAALGKILQLLDQLAREEAKAAEQAK